MTLKNSEAALIWSGIALIASYYTIIIYMAYSGHTDLAANTFFHGTVILIGALGFLLVCIGEAIGDESIVVRTIFVLGSVLSGLMTIFIIYRLLYML